MKFALVYRHFNLGGSIPRQHVEVARYLAERGHEVHVLSMAATTDPSLAPSCFFHPVRVGRVGTEGHWSARELGEFAWRAARALGEGNYDCVYSRLPGTWTADVLHLAGVAAGLARRAGVGSMRHTASLIWHPANAVRQLVEWRAVQNRRVQRFHVDSSQVADDLTDRYGVSAERIRVVPPGVNLASFFPPTDRATERRQLELPAGPPLVLFVGHDFRRKGLDRLIYAVARMREVALVAVVGGRDPAPFRALAVDVGVSDRLVFIGARTDTERLYRAADVFVLPTRLEMWGGTVVEAMASGCPPIVTSCAGSADVVESGRTGFVLSEPYNVEELAAQLDMLVASPRLRSEIGRRAREVAERLSWEHHGAIVERDLVGAAHRQMRAGSTDGGHDARRSTRP
jgi:glycosyltransferase involved in cell wall biosynthesis